MYLYTFGKIKVVTLIFMELSISYVLDYFFSMSDYIHYAASLIQKEYKYQ